MQRTKHGCETSLNIHIEARQNVHDLLWEKTDGLVNYVQTFEA